MKLLALALTLPAVGCLSSDFAENLQCAPGQECPPEQACNPNTFLCVPGEGPIEALIPDAFINTSEGDCETDEGAHYPLGTEIFLCVKNLPSERTLALGAATTGGEACEELPYQHLDADWSYDLTKEAWLSSFYFETVPVGTEVSVCWRNDITGLRVRRVIVITE